MPRKNPNLFDVMMKVPWWVSLVCGAVGYIAFKWILPYILIHSAFLNAGYIPVGKSFAKASSSMAPLVFFAFLLAAGLSALKQLFAEKLFDKQTGKDSIRAMSWTAFEHLISELYRRQGYSVVETGGGGADGGVDLVLRKNGERILVQCKHWQAYSVGVKVVREVFGVVAAENAAKGIIVTSGDFTQEALHFAVGKNLELIDGNQLVKLVKAMQGGKGASNAAPVQKSVSKDTDAPICPKCGKSMILRTARSGPNAGSKFWGCSGYPACRTTQNL